MATVQHYVRPQRLYRYRSLRSLDREIAAIRHGFLHCAAYTKLNDPMEGLFSSSRLLRESEDYRAIRAAISENKAQIGMCSFSEVHDHELMWAHYADQFRGICIAYSLPRLLRNLDKDVSFVRMYYNEAMPRVIHTNKSSAYIAKTILSYKNYRWLYEREWRMFAPIGLAHYRKPECATRVYLGSRIDPGHRIRLIEAMSNLGIDTQDMLVDEYSINFETCPQQAALLPKERH